MDVVDENRYATPAEAVLLRDQLRADEDARAALEASRYRAEEALAALKLAPLRAPDELDSAQSAHEDIVAREAALDARMSLARARLHPLRRLPDELLGQIFLEWRAACPYCRFRTGQKPKCNHVCLMAAAVCRWWRDVALGLPELWRELTVNFGRVDYSTIDRWVAHLAVRQARAGGLPLDVALEGDWEVVPAREERSRPFWDSVKLCFARSRSLSIFVDTYIIHPEFSACLDQDAPFLEAFFAEIWLPASSSSHSVSFFRSAPRLRELALVNSGARIEWHLRSTFYALTEASIHGSEACGLADLLHRAPNIETLVAYLVLIPSVPAGFSITSNALQDSDRSLKELLDSALVKNMHLPALRRARLSAGFLPHLAGRVIEAFLHHPMRTVEDLTLIGLNIDVLDGLQHANNVKTLCFECYSDTSTEALQDLSEPTGATGWICPLLADLTLPRRSAEFDAAELQAAILAFARARPQVSLSFLHPDGWPIHGEDIGDMIAGILASHTEAPVE